MCAADERRVWAQGVMERNGMKVRTSLDRGGIYVRVDC